MRIGEQWVENQNSLTTKIGSLEKEASRHNAYDGFGCLGFRGLGSRACFGFRVKGLGDWGLGFRGLGSRV